MSIHGLMGFASFLFAHLRPTTTPNPALEKVGVSLFVSVLGCRIQGLGFVVSLLFVL